MKTIIIQYYKTPYGELILGSFDNKICLADWKYRKMRSFIDKRIQKGLGAEYIKGESEVIGVLKKELGEYFSGQRKEFTVPLFFVGTDFQKSIWEELVKIPFGEIDTYLGLAQKINNEKSVRAVGTANGANAISILVPCHRIIGKNGDLVGYAGGLQAKKGLLKLESSLAIEEMKLSK